MNQIHTRWWPVAQVYFIGPDGLDADALAWTLSRRTTAAPPLTPVDRADAIPDEAPHGVLVLVPSSPRHADPVAPAVRSAQRGFRTIVLGVPLPARTRAHLLAHDIVHLTRDQVSALVTAVNTGVLKTAGPDEVARLTAAPRATPAPVDLTRRERELMRALRHVPYASRRQLAADLGMSEATVKVHLAHLRRKLGVHGGGRHALQREVLRRDPPVSP